MEESADNYTSAKTGRGWSPWPRHPTQMIESERICWHRKPEKFMEEISPELNLKKPIGTWQVKKGLRVERESSQHSIQVTKRIPIGSLYVWRPVYMCVHTSWVTLGRLDHLWVDRIKGINQGKHSCMLGSRRGGGGIRKWKTDSKTSLEEIKEVNFRMHLMGNM